MFAFEGKNVLVTGGTSGIGFATANRFIEAGARVLITGADKDRVRTAAETLGNQCVGLAADSASFETADLIARECEASLGNLDVMILNAGVCLADNIEGLSRETFDRQVSINMMSPIFTVSRCLPLMRAGGSILFTTSVNDVLGIPGQLIYSATKAAVRSFVRTLAADLAKRGIRVNGVAPGPIETPIFEKNLPTPEAVREAKEFEAGLTVMKRLGQPQEIADAFFYLASSNASYVTAIDLRVDGGWGET